jgi:peroxiredoxin
MSQIVQASFPILADANHAVADAYGVFNLLNDNTATPSIFIINPSGHVVWSYIGKDVSDRPSAAIILEHLHG